VADAFEVEVEPVGLAAEAVVPSVSSPPLPAIVVAEVADAVARAVVESPLLGRLEVLDLSLGNLTDVGAEALLASPAVRNLKKLDLHHHFITPPFVAQLKKLPVEVDVGGANKVQFSDYGGATHVYRYIVASE
jgi:hypothetical protein